MTNKVKEKMKLIYENFINGMPLKAANLSSLGISPYNINQFIENGLLIRDRHGYYELGNGDDYYDYCKSLLFSGNQYLGVKGITIGRVYNLFNNNYIIRDILDLLHDMKLLDASRVFIALMNVNLSDDQNKYRMGLYIFSTITELPEEYIGIASTYQKTDFLSADNHKYDLIVGPLWSQRWQKAMKRIKDMPDDTKNLFDKLLMSLCSTANNSKNEHREKIWEYLKNKDFNRVINYIEQMARHSRLDNYFSTILELTELLIDLEKTQEIPQIIAGNPSNSMEAIACHDYALALKLLQEREISIGNGEESPLLLVLQETVNKIKLLEKGYTKEDEIVNQVFISLNENNVMGAWQVYNQLLSFNEPLYRLGFKLFSLTIRSKEEVDEELLKTALSYEKEDLMVEGQDSLVAAIWQKKLKAALKILNESPTNFKSFEQLLIILCQKALALQEQRNEEIDMMINNQDYAGVVTYIEQIKELGALDTYFQTIQNLAQTLVNINSRKKIPIVLEGETNDFLTAINLNNYPLALRLMEEKVTSIKVYEETPLYKLLKEIVSRMAKVVEIVSVDSIYLQLLNKDIDGALESLRDYLTKANKREYEAFLVNLIKIDMADEDFTFARTISILSLVSKDIYSFNAGEYIRGYYEEKKARREKVSNLYLMILKIAKDNGWSLKLPRDIQLAMTLIPDSTNDATLKITYPNNN